MAVPSRTEVKEYHELKEEIHEAAAPSPVRAGQALAAAGALAARRKGAAARSNAAHSHSAEARGCTPPAPGRLCVASVRRLPDESRGVGAEC